MDPPLPSTTPPSFSHSSSGFPIIIIAIIGILATALLLLSYYIFVIKCCLNWHRIDLLRRFTVSRNATPEDPLMSYRPSVDTRGLDESTIRSIPTFRFNNRGFGEPGVLPSCECAVCLTEFQDNERLRKIPNCGHVFHIDCIDVWLQNNDNCPLCRSSVSSYAPRYGIDCIIAPSTTPQEPVNGCESVRIAGDEDYVVIELGDFPDISNDSMSSDVGVRSEQQEISNRLPRWEVSSEDISKAATQSHDTSFRGKTVRTKLEASKTSGRVTRKINKVVSMGDECIDIRDKDDRFAIQPIRRSISMDSSVDRQLYLSVREIVQHWREMPTEVSSCSSKNRRHRVMPD